MPKNKFVPEITGSALISKPLESHIFQGSDYLCSACKRPRALHQHDGFIPAPSRPPELISKGSYRAHPYFYHPGRLKHEKAKR